MFPSQLEAAAKLEILQDARSHLPALQRTAIALLTGEGLSYEEISKAMGLGLGAVKTHIHRGRQALADKFNSSKGDVT